MLPASPATPSYAPLSLPALVEGRSEPAPLGQASHGNNIEAAVNNDGIDSITKTPSQKANQGSLCYLPDQAVKIAYAFTPLCHLLAGLGKIFAQDSAWAKFLDKFSLIATRIVNGLNYLDKGQDALRFGRSWDAIARFVYPIVSCFSSVEDLFGLTGFSSGLSMHTDAQKARVHKMLGNNYNKPPFNWKRLKTEFIANCQVFPQLIKEIFESGFGKNRKLFLPEKAPEGQAVEQGHTMALGGHLNFSGAILTLASLATKHSIKPLHVLAAVIRNAGSIISDFAKLTHPDPNYKKATIAYFIVSALDFSQSLVSPAIAAIIGHFSQAFANIANYFYVNTSKATSDGAFKDYKLSEH